MFREVSWSEGGSIRGRSRPSEQLHGAVLPPQLPYSHICSEQNVGDGREACTWLCPFVVALQQLVAVQENFWMPGWRGFKEACPPFRRLLLHGGRPQSAGCRQPPAWWPEGPCCGTCLPQSPNPYKLHHERPACCATCRLSLTPPPLSSLCRAYIHPSLARVCAHMPKLVSPRSLLFP